MIRVPFPPPQFKIKTLAGKRHIFDALRRRWLLLTEEEWVRQNMVAFLLSLPYPKEAIALEKEILVNGLKKRFDLLVFNQDHQPWMLIECKAPQVQVNENVLLQALRYTLAVPVQWLLLTNGEHTAGWRKEGERLVMMEAFPAWGAAAGNVQQE